MSGNRSAAERPGFTLSSLRAFHEDKGYQLMRDKERRGAWSGEDLDREAFEATVRLLDRIAADETIVARLKHQT